MVMYVHLTWNSPECKNGFTSVWRIKTSGSFCCKNELSRYDFSGTGSQNLEDLSVTGAAPCMETQLTLPASVSEPWTEVTGADGQYSSTTDISMELLTEVAVMLGALFHMKVSQW